MECRLPAYGWLPRPHQRPLWNHFNDPATKRFNGYGKRAIQVAHRRFGKDDVALHLTCKASIERPASYWHLLPEYTQARKAIWTAVNPHTQRRRIDEAFPVDLRENVNEQEMFIRMKWGATWQVGGSDNFKNLVGAGVAGITFSEWAKAHPGAWAYLAPMLVENNGWALAITTPEGENHAKAMLELGLADKTGQWFAEVCDINETIKRCREAGVEPPVDLEDVEAQRLEYHMLYGEEAGDALIEQEWFCSFSAAILGAYWGKEMERAERQERICQIDPIPGIPIHRAWDIGMDDPMAIWVFQVGPGWVHMLDYVESSGHGFDYYADHLKERGYLQDKRGVDWVPHDAKQREPGAAKGRTRIETMFALGLNPKLVPDHKPMDRINAVRRLLPRVWFDEVKTKPGRACLKNFKQKWNDRTRTFNRTPDHNWASHGADAVGHLAIAVDFPIIKPKAEPVKGVEFKPLTVNDLLKYHKRGSGRRGD